MYFGSLWTLGVMTLIGAFLCERGEEGEEERGEEEEGEEGDGEERRWMG